MSFDWNPQNVELLKTMWQEGHSCSQIARALGPSVTRNAVIGKLKRIGVLGRGGRAKPSMPRTHGSQGGAA